MSSTHAQQKIDLKRLIVNASQAGSERAHSSLDRPLESWLREAESMRKDSPSVTGSFSDIKLTHEFMDYATILYALRTVLSSHPDYPNFTGELAQVRIKLNTVARELFEYLTELRLEIQKRAQDEGGGAASSIGPGQRRKALAGLAKQEEAWSGFKRDLQFENEAYSAGTADTQSPSEGGNLEDIPFESSSVRQTLAGSASHNEPGLIPDEPPSPQSYWIDLRPIEDAKADSPGRENGRIPEEPPVPSSYWIDLHPIEDSGILAPEVAPDPTSMFLELHPLIDLPAPEVAPSPVEVTLQLHESHD
ncbi:hypothetical protein FIBSPDRAFT_1042989 [Athelia psychrophila]|uniref:Uncharacterized protein n=1 Tax=Athelia psychrophila TaxID=1759441 RepID=A0A166LSM0_9AGAM|nr:hypothetical protein FIBSPDRAFT_1042989 [Fibularhizoctonia sp. CBS 109695]